MAGHRIHGFATATETSLTRKGMNPHAKKVLAKAALPAPADTPAPQPETTEMSTKHLLRVAAMSDVTKSYFVKLGDGEGGEDKAKAFLDKPVADQDAEAQAAHDEAEKAKAAKLEEEEKAKAADPQLVELQKSNAEMSEQLKTLLADKTKAALADKAKAYPGVPDALTVLESIQGLTEAQQEPILKSLATRSEMAKKLAKTYGEDRPEGEGSAKAEYDEKVKSVMTEKKIDKSAAILDIDGDPANAELITRLRAEMTPA